MTTCWTLVFKGGTYEKMVSDVGDIGRNTYLFPCSLISLEERIFILKIRKENRRDTEQHTLP